MNAYVSLQTERNWLMEGMRIFLTLGRIIKGSCFGTPNLGKKKEVLKSIPDMLGLFPITQTKTHWKKSPESSQINTHLKPLLSLAIVTDLTF